MKRLVIVSFLAGLVWALALMLAPLACQGVSVTAASLSFGAIMASMSISGRLVRFLCGRILASRKGKVLAVAALLLGFAPFFVTYYVYDWPKPGQLAHFSLGWMLMGLGTTVFTAAMIEELIVRFKRPH